MEMTHTHHDFFSALLTRIAVPGRRAGLRTLAAVSIFESSQGDEHWNNPLACTLFWPGATPYNAFGNNQHVWRYASFADGVHATAQLLAGPHWNDVRAALTAAKYRGPMLDAFTRAYTWADIDFRRAPFNVTAELDARLAHPLLGP